MQPENTCRHPPGRRGQGLAMPAGPVLGRMCLDRKPKEGVQDGAGMLAGQGEQHSTAIVSNLMGLSGGREIRPIPLLRGQN